jgi:hypothetical protein
MVHVDIYLFNFVAYGYPIPAPFAEDSCLHCITCALLSKFGGPLLPLNLVFEGAGSQGRRIEIQKY